MNTNDLQLETKASKTYREIYIALVEQLSEQQLHVI